TSSAASVRGGRAPDGRGRARRGRARAHLRHVLGREAHRAPGVPARCGPMDVPNVRRRDRCAAGRGRRAGPVSVGGLEPRRARAAAVEAGVAPDQGAAAEDGWEDGAASSKRAQVEAVVSAGWGGVKREQMKAFLTAMLEALDEPTETPEELIQLRMRVRYLERLLTAIVAQAGGEVRLRRGYLLANHHRLVGLPDTIQEDDVVLRVEAVAPGGFMKASM